mgnify:CR=1 FL=1
MEQLDRQIQLALNPVGSDRDGEEAGEQQEQQRRKGIADAAQNRREEIIEEREENAKQTVEKHDRVRIVRDDKHDAEERKHVHHRVRREAQILRENLRCHSFSFPRAPECPRATSARRRTARDSARGNRRACRCTGSARP